MEEEVVKYNPHHDSQGRFASGGGGGGGGKQPKGSKKLNRDEEKQMNNLAREMRNVQLYPPLTLRTGKLHTPSAQAHIKRGQDIVTRAQIILGGTRSEAMDELNRRNGVGVERPIGHD